MIVLGNVPAGIVLYLPFDTYNSSGASVTITGLAVTDIEIYKNGSITQRSSDNGYALLDTDGIDFDGSTGLHGFSIDLADNSDASFYAAGSTYWVHVNAITVDGQTVRFTYWFRLTIAEATTGVPRVDVYSWDGDSAAVEVNTELGVPNVVARGYIDGGTGEGTDYPNNFNTLTIANSAVAANITRYGGTAGTFSGGRPEVNVSHFGGTAGTFSAGRPEVNTTHAAGTAWGSGAITAAAIASSAFTSAKFATGALANGVFAAGAIDAAALAADTITAAKLAADVTTELQNGLATSASQMTLQTTANNIYTNTDVATSTRMATYTQPTGFLAATFPGTVASTTNITAAAGVAVSSIGTNVISAASIAAAAANKIADHNRRRTQANVEASGDGDALSLGSEYGMIQQIQAAEVSGTDLDVYQTDGLTLIASLALQSATSTDVIIGVGL